MRIIIETDSGEKHQIQMGAQHAQTSEGLQGAPPQSGEAIDAGPPKVGQQTTTTPSANEGVQQQGDTTSAGTAPRDLAS